MELIVWLKIKDITVPLCFSSKVTLPRNSLRSGSLEHNLRTTGLIQQTGFYLGQLRKAS